MKINKADREKIESMLQEIKRNEGDPAACEDVCKFYGGMAMALYDLGLIDNDQYWYAVVQPGVDRECAINGINKKDRRRKNVSGMGSAEV